jgi:hypothetical protein
VLCFVPSPVLAILFIIVDFETVFKSVAQPEILN